MALLLLACLTSITGRGAFIAVGGAKPVRGVRSVAHHCPWPASVQQVTRQVLVTVIDRSVDFACAITDTHRLYLDEFSCS